MQGWGAGGLYYVIVGEGRGDILENIENRSNRVDDVGRQADKRTWKWKYVVVGGGKGDKIKSRVIERKKKKGREETWQRLSDEDLVPGVEGYGGRNNNNKDSRGGQGDSMELTWGQIDTLDFNKDCGGKTDVGRGQEEMDGAEVECDTVDSWWKLGWEYRRP